MSDINEHVADLADDYLHALLSPGRAAEVERHCGTCPTCQAALEEARRRRAALQAVPPSEASPQLITATLRRIHTHDQTRRRRLRRFFLGGIGAVAAAALVVVGMQVHYERLSATPFDLVVLGQHDLLAATNSSLRIRLLDRAAGTALAGVPVVVELKGNGRAVELARFTTDAHGGGQPRFRLPDWPDGDYGLLITAQTPGEPETVSRSVRLKRSWKLMVSSDKPVYQPGQTIHVRTLALRQPDLLPVAGQNTVFTIADPKGNVLFKQQGQSSQYGIAFTDCLLDREIAEGPCTIACKVGDTESSLRVEVKKYVLPKFKVDVKPDRSFYQPGDTANLAVQADYFFGKPVADAAVKIEVRTLDVQPRVLATLEARTDAKGTASAACTLPKSLPGRPQDNGDARLTFQVSVTDSAGQKQTRGVERLVTTQPVRIEVVPEGGTLVRGVANTVYLLATRADGTPVRARLTIGGLNEVVDTDANGLASCEVTPRTEAVHWIIEARDAREKQLARRDVILPCGPGSRDFLLRTDRAVYEAGQTMRLTVDGDGVEPVFVDFIKEGQTLLTQTIAVDGGRGSSAFDLPPDLFGTVQVCAYRLNAEGLAVSRTRVVYIRPAGQLKITPKLDRAEYRPGGRARLEMTLTDAAGKPCPGAISLAGVDEAVFAVLQQRPGMEETFYTLEKQLLKPVYTLYPWSPDRKAPEAERLEQALFAATAHSETPKAPTSGLHSLTADTFTVKAQEVERDRRHGIDRVKIAWVMLVLAGLGLGYIALWCFVRPLIVVILHAAIFLVVLPFAVSAFLVMNTMSAQKQAGLAAGADRESADLTNAVVSRESEAPLNFDVNRIEDVNVPGPVDPTVPVGTPARPRVRKVFAETLLWEPQLITDDNGRAHLDIDLADSITTWRISASAVAADGRLGSTQLPLKVFQPFFVDLNLPVSLTRGDEVGVPVVVYNYLDKPQTVTLKLDAAPWFKRLGDAEQRLDLAAREVRSIHYRLRVEKAGTHELQVSALASGIGDAVKRTVEVVPDGRRVEQVFNGSLQQPGGATLLVPDNAIEGSVQAFVKLYPSSFSQVVEGLENIFQMPHGCFEQTSSTTYPNVLALDYLRRTKRSAPQVEARARQFIHLGYQRLIGFEVSGGGFDWFGHPPANRTLTAYGLMEFEDMARVHDVDPQLIERTRRWLLDQRKSDGSWAPEGHTPHDAPAGGGDATQARVAATAYIAWAVFGHGALSQPSPPGGEGRVRGAGPTRDYLLGHKPDGIKDPNTLALVCNALLALDPQGDAVGPYLDRLEAMKHRGEDGKQVWWQQAEGARTTFYGTGRSGNIETTALAALALLGGKRHPGTVRAALTWLVAQKDAHGTWHSTQATVLSLKALLAATPPFSPPKLGGEKGGGEGERRIVVQMGDKLTREIVIPADQAEVLKQIDLSPYLTAGRQRVTLTEKSRTGAGFQVTFRYHVPEAKAAEKAEPLTVTLTYDRTELAVNDTVQATATASNHMPQAAPMVMLELPIPAGFAPSSEDFTALVQAGDIARFQVEPRRVVVYLRGLTPGKPLSVTYRLRATMPVKVAVPGARVYEYYDPDREGRSPGVRMIVTAPK